MKNFKKQIIILSGFLILLSSCSNPLNNKYSDSTLAKDAAEIKDSKKLNDDEIKMLAGYIMLAKLGGKSLEGKTYADILKDAKNIKNEQEELALKTKKEQEEKQTKLGAVLTVALYDKGFSKEDYDSYLTYSVAIENKSDKNIKAIKGSMVINDLFDTEITTLNLVEDTGIAAKQIYKTTYTSDYNQFKSEDKLLKSKDLKDLKVIWLPEKIIFEDGTTLE